MATCCSPERERKASLGEEEQFISVSSDEISPSITASPSSKVGNLSKKSKKSENLEEKRQVSRWLYDLVQNEPQFKSIPITRLKLPGTHDSGCYGRAKFLGRMPFVYQFAEWNWRTQRDNIKKQLERGIRYFDLRFGLVKRGRNVNFAPHHGVMPETGDDLFGENGILNQILSFLNNHGEKELIFFDITDFQDLRTDEDYRIFWEGFMNEEIVRRSLPHIKEGEKFPTLGELWEGGHSVIVMTDQLNRVPNSLKHLVWPRIPSYYQEDVWKGENPQLIKKHIEEQFPKEEKFWVAQCQLTPVGLGRISPLHRRMNPALKEWLQTEHWRNQTSIIIMDFPSDELIYSIIDLNLGLIKNPTMSP
eukprot:TRINITY_DN8426_c0_g1_i1.p1 TRINITY_DN8426_c0_g1~~TRINITY_DN8426_c0_g1_i1.p1  ORF type:complete len:362 (-),score=110.41 TRINITY_DN8426_c0_g1_i1:13-1098(-)